MDTLDTYLLYCQTRQSLWSLRRLLISILQQQKKISHQCLPPLFLHMACGYLFLLASFGNYSALDSSFTFHQALATAGSK